MAVPIAPPPAPAPTPVTSPASSESAVYRKILSESYGFKQIGERLPEDVTLKDIINTIPKKVILLCMCVCISMWLVGIKA